MSTQLSCRSKFFGISLVIDKKDASSLLEGEAPSYLTNCSTLPFAVFILRVPPLFCFCIGLSGIDSQGLCIREAGKEQIFVFVLDDLTASPQGGEILIILFADGHSAVGRGRGERIGWNSQKGNPAPAPLPLSWI